MVLVLVFQSRCNVEVGTRSYLHVDRALIHVPFHAHLILSVAAVAAAAIVGLLVISGRRRGFLRQSAVIAIRQSHALAHSFGRFAVFSLHRLKTSSDGNAIDSLGGSSHPEISFNEDCLDPIYHRHWFYFCGMTSVCGMDCRLRHSRCDVLLARTRYETLNTTHPYRHC